MENYGKEKDGTFLGSFEEDAAQERDSLLFHGVPQKGEESEEKREELEEKIRELIRTEYGIECKDKMEAVFRLDHFYTLRTNTDILPPRWTQGPKVNGFSPVLVKFKEKKTKDRVWKKMKKSLSNGSEASESESSEEEQIKTKTKGKTMLMEKHNQKKKVYQETAAVMDKREAKLKPKKTLKYYGKIKRDQSPKKISRAPEKNKNIKDNAKSNPIEIESPATIPEAPEEATSEDTLLIHGLEKDWVEQEMKGDTEFM